MNKLWVDSKMVNDIEFNKLKMKLCLEPVCFKDIPTYQISVV